MSTTNTYNEEDAREKMVVRKCSPLSSPMVVEGFGNGATIGLIIGALIVGIIVGFGGPRVISHFRHKK